IMDIKMPQNSLILSVIRGQSQDTIPDGNFILSPGDTVISIVDKKSLSDLEKVFMTAGH
ncbi:MAG: Trk system potassium transporter TrkA, partial [Spirochaetales bacterium]